MIWSRRVPRLLAAAAGALALGIPVAAAGTAAAAPGSASPATSPDAPVDLATPVNFAAAVAARGATVTAGDARFEVLGDGLIRMEYSPAGNFENLPTVNAVNRRFPVPAYRAGVSDGWLTITTSEAALRYRLGSGPFGPSNVSVRYQDAGQSATASPAWQNECPYGQVCDAGAAALSGPANIQTDHANYQSVAGFIAGLGQGNSGRGHLDRPGRPGRPGPGDAALLQLPRRARRPGAAHHRPRRQRHGHRAPDAAPDGKLGRLGHG